MELYDRAFNQAEELLSNELPRRWSHVQAVGSKALSVGSRLMNDTDQEALAVSAILHDIGYASELAATGFHPLDGARWLRDHGWNKRIVDLVAHHSCAAVEAEERGLREVLEAEFQNEASEVTEALWYCDMTTGPTGLDVEVGDRLTEILERYGPDHVVSRFIRKAQSSIMDAVSRTEARLLSA
ncbi:HDIG domain-containing metalloprotein [Glycomyces tenuis]|uniref:HDIG domain-containing metalloprotein n=1 Tax=Glycomyces tenuis TaxID=58116 RepID=UPI0009DB9F83|nr:HDIG domain-containing metalloprotein [Glycomyces tenuis]